MNETNVQPGNVKKQVNEANKQFSLLIVEDEPALRNNMELILKLEGYSVRSVGDGLGALSQIRSKRPDLILCDILMPGMDGYAFHEAVKGFNHLATIPFLFVSALNSPEQVRKGMNVGADDYLTKPFSAEELLTAVAARLRRFSSLRTVTKSRGGPTEEESRKLRLLTPREWEILLLVAKGKSSRLIGELLFISPRTVDVHRNRLLRKLGAANAASLAHWATLAEHMYRAKAN
ncbi:MAG: response regulator transcription factor [Proteobacteria bacterium]|nr:response regulator transcription factor [Pseudomonadota bacterium]